MIGTVEAVVTAVAAVVGGGGVAAPAVESLATLRVVGAVVAGAGPGTLQAPLLSDVGRRVGNHTTTAPINSTPITVSAGQ
jgi:hypothetical protein